MLESSLICLFFPSQEILDVFLFLTKKESRTEAEKLLGFIPEEIIFSGDSSGACLSLAVLVILHEMKKLWPKETLCFPSAIFGFYPSFSLAPTLFSSYIVTGTTPFLNPIAFALFADSYVPLISHSSDVNANHCKERGVYEPEADINRPPFSANVSLEELKEKINRRRKITEHPLFSPLLYEDMESLKEVSMFLFPCLKDPVLDHSVCIGKKWKGPFEMHVMNNLQHGFLSMIGLDSDAREGADFVVDRLKNFLQL